MNNVFLACGVGCLVMMGSTLPRHAHTHAQPGDEGDPSARVYVQDSPLVQEEIMRSLSFAQERRYIAAAERLHTLMRERGSALVEVEPGLYMSVQERVRRVLADNPELGEAYRASFGSDAERRLNEAIEGGVEEAALRSVAQGLWYTRAGLEANLLLAGGELERGYAEAARDRLAELASHPDAASVADRRIVLLATARLLSGRATTAETALANQAVSPQLRTQVERFAAALTLDFDALLGRGDRPSIGDPDRLLGKTLWEVRLNEVLEMGTQAALRRRVREQLFSQAALGQYARPVVSRDRIVVKTADNLYAVDRDSGRLLWRLELAINPLEQLDDPRTRRQMLHRVTQRMQQTHGGADAAGDDLVARVNVGVQTSQRHVPANAGEVIKVDASTGRMQWRVTPAELDESLAGTMFTGDPVIRGESVYAFVIERHRTGLLDVRLTAMSRVDGRLRWSGHVSSLATSRRGRGGAVSPQMKFAGGRLYVSDGIASVACFDAATGRVRWARIVRVSQGQAELGLASDNALGPRYASPIRVPGGLLVNLGSKPRTTMLIDADTGEIVRELQGSAWGAENLLLPWKGDLVSVHPRRVRRIDGETLEMLWTRDIWSPDVGTQRLQGVPALGDRYAAVPTDNGVFMIDLDKGRIAQRFGSGESGHALFLDGQIVLADQVGLVSYLNWEQTSRRLRRQIAEQPANPAPALDLVRVAFNLDRGDAIVEALDAAAAAAARSGGSEADTGDADSDARRMVFEELRGLAGEARPDQSEAVGMLLAKIGRLADTPEERATYHLMQGKHDAATGRAKRAVEHLQRVLAEEELAHALFETPRASRRAAVEARRQLDRLLQEADGEIYAAFRDEARSELASLTAGTARAPERLESLARRYPFAPASARALLEAARAYRVMERPEQAASALRRGEALAKRTGADRDVILAAILGEMVDLYLATDRSSAAVRELRRIARQQPDLALRVDSRRLTASAWLAEVGSLASDAATRPRWGPPLSEPRRLAGAPLPAAVPQDPRGPVLFTDRNGGIVALSHDAMSPLWSVQRLTADAEHTPVIVARREGRIVIWNPGTAELIALSETDGSEAWRRRAGDVFGVDDRAIGPPPAQPASEPRVAAINNNVRIMIAPTPGPAARQRENPSPHPSLRAARALVDTAGDLLAWALPSGRFAVLDLDDGQSLWRRQLRNGSLDGIRISQAGVAVWGRVGNQPSTASGTCRSFHLRTGEPQTGVIETEQPPVHAAIGEEGLLLALPMQVRRYDPATGELVWRTDIAGAEIQRGGWASEGGIVYVDGVSNALALSTRSGEMLWRKPVGISNEDPVQWARPTPGAVTLLARSGLAHFDIHRGQVWRDAVILPRKRLYAAALSHRHAIVAADDGGSVPIFGDPRNFENPTAVRLFLLERDTGRLTHQFRVDAAPTPMDPRLTRLTDHWLVLSDGRESLLLRGEPEAEPTPAKTTPSTPTDHQDTPRDTGAEL